MLEPDGSVTIGSVTFRRTPERVKRRTGRDYVDSGAVIVTDVYPEGPVLHQGESAKQKWQEISGRIVSGPDSKPTHEYWSGHVFESDSGLVLLWLDGHH